jgi:phosphoglycerate dehydrogenase-like enzyme
VIPANRLTGLGGFLLAALGLLAPGPARSEAAATPPPADAEAVTALIRNLELVEAPTALRDTPGWRKPRRIAVRTDGEGRLAWFQAAVPGADLIGVATEEEALAVAGRVDALLGFCSPELVAAGTRLRWIQLYTAGSGPCTAIPGVGERKILVTNMQRISAPAIAEHVMAMMLALSRGLHLYIPQKNEARWAPGALPAEQVWELPGRTLLVVGLGGIGTEVARRAHGLGMRVVATRASAAPAPAFVAHVGPPGELLALAAQADVVVNATPLVPSTENLFDRRFFDAVKPGALFINVGRGGSVVQEDLLAALRDGRLAGAGLDVTDPEPLPPDHPLWREPTVIITPHVAASSDRIRERVFLLARENLRRYVAGGKMLSVVDVQRGY